MSRGHNGPAGRSKPGATPPPSDLLLMVLLLVAPAPLVLCRVLVGLWELDVGVVGVVVSLSG